MLLIFSFVSRNSVKPSTLTLKNNKLSIKPDPYGGCDHRYFNFINGTIVNPDAPNHLKTLEDNYRFNKNFYKLRLLTKLLNKDISEVEKLKELEIYNGYKNESKYVTNLSAGGLYKDWDTTIL